ncbi:MAG: fumarylacetoacetate hydrolase family protein [Terriglobales bacterium]
MVGFWSERTLQTVMKLYRTSSGYVVEERDRFYLPGTDLGRGEPWELLTAKEDLHEHLQHQIHDGNWIEGERPALHDLRAPIGNQEVWAAGVTYYRSREARMQESKSAGGGDFYDRVYDAERPELFFKGTPHRVVGPGGKVAIREDSSWSVPEPELALLVSPEGSITGYTIGNDMSSRSIEGENPLYLPQAKVYDRSCALGPCILVAPDPDPLPSSTEISLEILRATKSEFAASTTLSSMKRDPASLVEYLYRSNSFPSGCFLLTGTGIVPPDSFTLAPGDEIRIAITGIGILVNTVG